MQQINLYQERFRKQKSRLSSARLLKAVAALAGLMLGLGLLFLLQAGQRQAQLDTLQAQQKAKMAQLASLQQQVQSRHKDAALQARVDALMREIDTKQKIMKILGEQRFGNIEGFTGHVRGLARQRLDGLWLTQVRIGQGGATLGMKGRALKAALLPRYLQRLSGETVFAGKTFETLSMERDAEQPGQVLFELRGEGESPPADAGKLRAVRTAPREGRG